MVFNSNLNIQQAGAAQSADPSNLKTHNVLNIQGTNVAKISNYDTERPNTKKAPLRVKSGSVTIFKKPIFAINLETFLKKGVYCRNLQKGALWGCFLFPQTQKTM